MTFFIDYGTFSVFHPIEHNSVTYFICFRIFVHQRHRTQK